MTAQELLWELPSRMDIYWHILMALVALPTGFVLFWFLIFRQPFSALLIARTGWLGAIVCVVFTPFNSGWIPWVVFFMVFSGAWWAVLLATGWCERENKQDSMGRVVWRWTTRALNRLLGPYKQYSPDDTWRKM